MISACRPALWHLPPLLSSVLICRGRENRTRRMVHHIWAAPTREREFETPCEEATFLIVLDVGKYIVITNFALHGFEENSTCIGQSGTALHFSLTIRKQKTLLLLHFVRAEPYATGHTQPAGRLFTDHEIEGATTACFLRRI